MNIGVVFPQTEFGNDPIAIRDYAQTAEALGFSHVLAYDHVIGANPNRPGGWQVSYGDGNPDTWQALMRDWRAASATHFSVNTMGLGFGAPAAHIDALRRFAAAMGITQRS